MLRIIWMAPYDIGFGQAQLEWQFAFATTLTASEILLTSNVVRKWSKNDYRLTITKVQFKSLKYKRNYLQMFLNKNKHII